MGYIYFWVFEVVFIEIDVVNFFFFDQIYLVDYVVILGGVFEVCSVDFDINVKCVGYLIVDCFDNL